MDLSTATTFPVTESEDFWNMARSLGVRRKDAIEDFLTDCFAGAMRDDSHFARSVLQTIYPMALSSSTATSPIIDINTQVTFGGSTLDLVFKTNSMCVGVEIKLRSPEGPGQLAKYLELDKVDTLAFLAPNIRNVANEVYNHPKYCRPSTGQRHFLWSDFYPLVTVAHSEAVAASMARRGLLGLFNHLDLRPKQQWNAAGRTSASPRPVGHSTTQKMSAAEKDNLRVLLLQTRSDLQQLGWQMSHAPNGELWTEVRSRQLAQVWVDCVNRPGYLRVNLRFPNLNVRSRVESAFNSPLAEFPGIQPSFELGKSSGKEDRTRYTLFIITPMDQVLDTQVSSNQAAHQLSRYICSLVTRAEQALRK